MTPGGGTPCVGTGSNQMLYGDVPNEYVNIWSKFLKDCMSQKPFIDIAAHSVFMKNVFAFYQYIS